MSINIGDNFKYLGKKFLDDRQSFNTLLDMKKCNDVPLGFITFCKEDSKRYEYFDSIEEDPITGKWREYKVGADIDPDLLNHKCSYVGSETPEDDDVIWFDSGESNQTEINYDNPIISELLACIKTLQDQVKQLQADVEYLKINGGGSRPDKPDKPDPGPDEPGTDEPIVTEESFLALEDGGIFLLEDGGSLLLEISEAVTTDSVLTLEDGSILLLENGDYIVLENSNVSPINKPVILLEDGSKLLFEDKSEILLEERSI